jgi:hypothetical protein
VGYGRTGIDCIRELQPEIRTLLGLLRVSSNAKAMRGQQFSSAEAWAIYQTNRGMPDCELRHDPLHLETAFAALTLDASLPHRLWTDAYLAGFAIAGAIRLGALNVTLDDAASTNVWAASTDTGTYQADGRLSVNPGKLTATAGLDFTGSSTRVPDEDFLVFPAIVQKTIIAAIERRLACFPT